MYSTATLPNIPHPLPPSHQESAYYRRNQNYSKLSPRHRRPTHHHDELLSRVTGLRTPPFDDMGTTYQPANLAPYESHQAPVTSYHSTMAHVDRSRSTKGDMQDGQHNCPRYQVYNSVQQQQLQPQSHARHGAYSSTPSAPIVATQPSSQHSTRPSTPNSVRATHNTDSGGSARRRLSNMDSQAMVLHSLQVPTCISHKGGNLAEFSANLTCLLWFESPKTLEAAEVVHTLAKNASVRRPVEAAIPSLAFIKWVETVLSTTQVTQNVILLALMFIYRLKMTNPAVRGRPGSEYRLLTVALMLGNKFLDDNTYTNKTWAEVSGISVQEIHVMEVEFLSNVKYNLLASKEQWEDWLKKCAKYFEYCDRAARPISPLVIPSPTGRSFHSPLSSPTTTLQSSYVQSTSPPRSINRSGPSYLPHESNVYSNNPTSMSGWPTPYHATPALSPLANRPDLGNNRKRSMVEEYAAEPPAKRLNRAQSSEGTALPDPIRLPVPNLTLNTAQSAPASQPQYTATTYANPPPLSLPPLTSGTRAMATVYPSAATSWAPQHQVQATSGPSMPSSTTHAPASTVHYAPTNTGYGTPTKRLSPINTLNPAAAYGTSSPLTEHYPHHGVHTPISHSPSVYLQQRSSPYKPIRHVKTLLCPPPSASLHQYHLSGAAVPPTQMHYQPLGRRNEFRTGIVPEFQNPMMYGGNMRQQQQHHPSQGQQRMPPNGQYPN